MNTDKTMVAKGFGGKNFPILNKGNQVARCEGEIGVPNHGPRAVKGWSQSWNIAKMQIVGERIRRKHIFGNGSKDVQLLYEDGLRRTTFFFSTDRVTAKTRERFEQLQNLAQKHAFLRHEVILSMDEFNLVQAPQDISEEEFQLDSLRLQVFVAATDPVFKKNSLGPALWFY
ncbi:uncharacterized protein TNCV_1050251 [Trichonephila clavipes]|nr:uncharacterized protein TNCV_1050251 [Trichonephila clavipes]